jgi:hypothetical protein
VIKLIIPILLISEILLLKKLLGKKNIKALIWIVLWISGLIYVSTGGCIYLSAIVYVDKTEIAWQLIDRGCNGADTGTIIIG